MMIPEFIRWLERQQSAEKTVKNYSNKVRIFVAWLDTKLVGVPEVDPDRVLQFHNHLMVDRKQKASTRATYLNALRKYGEFLIIQGLFKKNPFREISMPKIHKAPPDQMNENEIALMMHAAFEKKNEKGLRDLAIVAMLTGTACRVTALAGMRIQDFRPSEITIPEQCQRCGQGIVSGPHAGRGKKIKVTMVRLREKGGKEWDVIVPEKASFFLSQYLNSRKIGIQTDVVFPVKRYGTIKPISRHGVLYAIKRLAKVAGISRRISPHSFRHVAITWWLDTGIDPDVVRQWVGHSALSQTMEYRNKSIRSFVWSGIATDKNLMAHVQTPLDVLFKKLQ
jgi:integrase/recombinase XerD